MTYAHACGRRLDETTYMHRLILGLVPGDGQRVDHRDLNGLNNVRSNLRLCTSSQNLANGPRRVDNTSGYRGVGWDRQHRRWVAKIQVRGRTMNLGLFRSPEQAALAYDAAAREHFGEFARPNFSDV